ncbi:putative ubiquitin-like-specific protease 2A [Sesamum angolense]|uniref:Ubiquitin-like-specific protease 2A n=1 Tax=Sesamum angolense TaxID=2727404 RepID=A0AAE2BXX7_9LAMI|nr:putative ubiquitin-like-specific protease 2A [Sesamum angolense]
MGKRRNAKYKSSTAGEVNSTGASYGGGSSKDDKFSVFEFADDDLRVETESRKTLAKFGTRSPSKKPAHHHQLVDKYLFLEYCKSVPARIIVFGTLHEETGHSKMIENDMPDFDVTDSVPTDRTFETDVKISPGSLNYKSHAFSVLRHQVSESPCVSKSCEQRNTNPGGCTTGTKHNKVFSVDSDEDERMELRSPSSSFALADNAGSLKEESSEYRSRSNDCEAVVVVAPKYVKYGDRCIRLEGSPLGERKRLNYLEWPTFNISKFEYQQCESVKADAVNLHFKYKDTNVAETGNTNSGTMELEFVVLDDPQWSEKQEEIKSLDVKYKASWETILSKCSFHESFEEIIYPDGDPDAVLISRKDIDLLQPRTFINDSIIDFYIKYLLNKTKAEMQHRFHFFNTFFFRKLADMDHDLSRPWEGRDAFQRVRKWTRNVNLFEKDYIFIPVNFSLHWSLIVICHPGEINLWPTHLRPRAFYTWILSEEAIEGSHQTFLILKWQLLVEEWKERHNKQEEDVSAKFSNLDFVALQLPQQENSFDCGLFLLHYAELFLEQALNFSDTKSIDYEEPEKQATSSPECTMNRYQADEDDKEIPCHCLLSSFRMGEIKASQGTSKTCTGKSPIIIDLQNDEDCVPEAASALKRDKERNDDSSILSEDLATCVVEDSEDE